MFCWSEYIFSIIVLHLAFGTATRTLIHSHKGPVFRDLAAQTTDGDFIVRVPGFPSSTILYIRVATQRAHICEVESSIHVSVLDHRGGITFAQGYARRA